MGLLSRTRTATRATFILPIRVYQKLISPLTGANCRYVPTCSEYMAQAVERYGCLRGTWKGICRIMRCHPLGGSGYDPVDPSDTAETNREA